MGLNVVDRGISIQVACQADEERRTDQRVMESRKTREGRRERKREQRNETHLLYIRGICTFCAVHQTLCKFRTANEDKKKR
jgi:hypothetical protein